MKTITDSQFVKTFVRTFSQQDISTHELAKCHIEVRGNHGKGLRIRILLNRRELVELGWWPDYGASAAWPTSATPMFRRDLERRTDSRLSRLVRNFLVKHGLIGPNGRSMLEMDAEIETICKGIRDFGRGIAEQRWDYALSMWNVISTMEGVKDNPDYANVGIWLGRQKWFAESQPVGVH